MGFDEFIASRVLQTAASGKVTTEVPSTATNCIKIVDNNSNKNIDKIDKSKDNFVKRLLATSATADKEILLNFIGDQKQLTTTLSYHHQQKPQLQQPIEFCNSIRIYSKNHGDFCVIPILTTL